MSTPLFDPPLTAAERRLIKIRSFIWGRGFACHITRGGIDIYIPVTRNTSEGPVQGVETRFVTTLAAAERVIAAA